MHVFYKGVRVEIQITGTSEVQNIDGTKELHLHVAASLPGGPGGPGEPLPIAEAA